MMHFSPARDQGSAPAVQEHFLVTLNHPGLTVIQERQSLAESERKDLIQKIVAFTKDAATQIATWADTNGLSGLLAVVNIQEYMGSLGVSSNKDILVRLKSERPDLINGFMRNGTVPGSRVTVSDGQ